MEIVLDGARVERGGGGRKGAVSGVVSGRILLVGLQVGEWQSERGEDGEGGSAGRGGSSGGLEVGRDGARAEGGGGGGKGAVSGVVSCRGLLEGKQVGERRRERRGGEGVSAGRGGSSGGLEVASDGARVVGGGGG